MSKHIRHRAGSVRPYLFGDLDLPSFVEQVFDAVEVDRQWVGDKACHYEARIGNSFIVS